MGKKWARVAHFTLFSPKNAHLLPIFIIFCKSMSEFTLLDALSWYLAPIRRSFEEFREVSRDLEKFRGICRSLEGFGEV